jgi:hypothetical protein
MIEKPILPGTEVEFSVEDPQNRSAGEAFAPSKTAAAPTIQASQKTLLLVAAVCILVGLLGGWYLASLSNNKAVSSGTTINTATTTEVEPEETVAPESNLRIAPSEEELSEFKGRSTYSDNPETGNFSIKYPKQCVVNSEEVAPGYTYNSIICDFEGKKVSIVPEAAGHGAEVDKKDTKLLAGIEWNRTYFEKDGASWNTSYYSDANGVGYLLEVHYDTYSDELETEVEKIITSFTAL